VFKIVRIISRCKLKLFRTSECIFRRQTVRSQNIASVLSDYIISCLGETFTVLWNVAHRQSETYDTQMNQNRIYCKQRSIHLLVVPVVRIHAALLRTNMGWISQR